MNFFLKFSLSIHLSLKFAFQKFSISKIYIMVSNVPFALQI